jgi:hypothetical protein
LDCREVFKPTTQPILSAERFPIFYNPEEYDNSLHLRHIRPQWDYWKDMSNLSSMAFGNLWWEAVI